MPNNNLNLFALTNDPRNKIVKFRLSHEIQTNLSNYFIEQESDFLSNIEETIEFDGKYKPDNNELLKISNFDDLDNLESAVRNPLDIVDIDPSEDSFSGIKALFSGYIDDDNKAKILIQRFEKRRIITNNGFTLFHSNDVYKRIEDIGLTIDNKLTGILYDGILTFKSFHLMRQIFDLSDYYREATDSDISDFSNLTQINIVDLDKFLAISDSWIRRKISLIQQSGILDNVPLRTIKAVADDFSVCMFINASNQIEIPAERKAVKAILRLLDEDYYKSPLSQTHCIANSKRVIE